MIWYVQLERPQLHPSPQPPSVDIMAIFNTRALVRRNYCKLIGSVLPSCSCQKVRTNLPCKTAGPKAAQNVIFLAQPRPRSSGSWKDPGGGCENIFQDEQGKPNLTSLECQKQLDTNRMYRNNIIKYHQMSNDKYQQKIKYQITNITSETMPKRDEHQTIRFVMSDSVPSFCEVMRRFQNRTVINCMVTHLLQCFYLHRFLPLAGLILYNYTDCGMCHATRLRTRQRHFGRLLQTLSFVYMIFSLCHCIFIACNHQWRWCNPWICVGYIHDVVAQIQNPTLRLQYKLFWSGCLLAKSPFQPMEFPLLIRRKINTNKKYQWSVHFP